MEKIMARRTQGTDIWGVAESITTPGEWELFKVDGALNFKPGTDSKERIEITPLDEEESKQYMEGGGLKDTGQSTFDLNADPKVPSHGRLYDLEASGKALKFIVGWAGKNKGEAKSIVPSIDAATGEVTLPLGRSWNTFTGYVDSFPMDLDANTVVKTTCTVQRSTKVAWIRETA